MSSSEEESKSKSTSSEEEEEETVQSSKHDSKKKTQKPKEKPKKNGTDDDSASSSSDGEKRSKKAKRALDEKKAKKAKQEKRRREDSDDEEEEESNSDSSRAEEESSDSDDETVSTKRVKREKESDASSDSEETKKAAKHKNAKREKGKKEVVKKEKMESSDDDTSTDKSEDYQPDIDEPTDEFRGKELWLVRIPRDKKFSDLDGETITIPAQGAPTSAKIGSMHMKVTAAAASEFKQYIPLLPSTSANQTHLAIGTPFAKQVSFDADLEKYVSESAKKFSSKPVPENTLHTLHLVPPKQLPEAQLVPHYFPAGSEEWKQQHTEKSAKAKTPAKKKHKSSSKH